MQDLVGYQACRLRENQCDLDPQGIGIACEKIGGAILESTMKDVIEKEKELKKERVRFLYDHHKVLFQTLICDLNNENNINSEELLYFPEKYETSDDHFHTLFNFTESFFIEEVGESVTNYDGFDGGSYYLRYEDNLLKFYVVQGQGTFRRIEWADENELSKNSVVSIYEEWLYYLAKKIVKLKLEEKV